MEKNTIKIKELFDDKDFCEKINSCISPVEICSTLASYGVEIDPDEYAKYAEDFATRQATGELTEEELDATSGGIFISGSAFLIGSIIYCVICYGFCKWSLSNRRR